jgi:hypothetical protein
MGNKLFGVDVSGLIKQYVGPGVLSVTITKVAAGTRTVGALAGGTNPTSTSYACKGFIDRQEVRWLKGTMAPAGTKRVVIIGDTVSGGAVAPALDDLVVVEGITYTVATIDRDPAAATYTLVVTPH